MGHFFIRGLMSSNGQHIAILIPFDSLYTIGFYTIGFYTIGFYNGDFTLVLL
jgi:hypothetical protein